MDKKYKHTISLFWTRIKKEEVTIQRPDHTDTGSTERLFNQWGTRKLRGERTTTTQKPVGRKEEGVVFKVITIPIT